MPGAVIVATARSPLAVRARAPLASVRPDDLAGRIVARGAWPRSADFDPADVGDLVLGCGLPGGEQGFRHGPRGSDTAWTRSPASHHRQPVLLVVLADHPDRLPRDQGRRGNVYISAGVECVGPTRPGAAAIVARYQEPRLRRAQGRTEAGPARGNARTWRDPRADGLVPDIYIAMGKTTDVAGLRGVPASSRTRLAYASASWPRGQSQRLLAARDDPGHPCPATDRRHGGRRTPAGDRRIEKVAALERSSTPSAR